MSLGGAVTLRHHKGCFLSLTNTKTYRHESHLKDLKVSIIQSNEWKHLGKEDLTRSLKSVKYKDTVGETANSCVTYLFISHPTNNQVTPLLGSLVIRQTDVDCLVFDRAYI